jgi:hypothetical protein
MERSFGIDGTADSESRRYDEREKVPRIPRTASEGTSSLKENARKKRSLSTGGKVKGVLTQPEVNEHIPESITSSAQMDDRMSAIPVDGIEFVDSSLKIERNKGEGEEEEDADHHLTTVDPTACICARWDRWRCSRVRERWRLPSGWRTASGACCRQS